jgi:hypothetical protein
MKYHDILKENPEIFIIGHTVDLKEGTHLVTPEGSKIKLAAQGWNTVRGR